MDTTPGVVKRLLRNLYHPVALRRDPLANAIRLTRRRSPAPRAFDEADIRLVQRSILSWVMLLDAEQPTQRGEAQRKRQRLIIERYDVSGHQRAAVASELGISLRQFYRERHVALERIADMIAQEMMRTPEAGGFEDGASFGRAV